MYKYQFTVFTCCYNGAHTIHRVIESLKKQTFRDFEWIIVNNGSTDNIYEVIKPVIDENLFPVKYLINTPNNFNMANNLGVSNAEGEFFLLLDADDEIVDKALETYYNTYKSLSEILKHEIAGIVGNCIDQHGNFIGTPYPLNDPNGTMLICDELEMRYKYKVKGEKCGFIKTNIRREFPMNTDIDIYIPVNQVWFAIANKYKSVYINEILRVYYINDGNYHIVTHERHPAGHAFYFEEVINKYQARMNLLFFGILKNYLNFIRFSFAAGQGIFIAIKKLNKIHKRLFACVCILPGYFVYLLKR